MENLDKKVLDKKVEEQGVDQNLGSSAGQESGLENNDVVIMTPEEMEIS